LTDDSGIAGQTSWTFDPRANGREQIGVDNRSIVTDSDRFTEQSHQGTIAKSNLCSFTIGKHQVVIGICSRFSSQPSARQIRPGELKTQTVKWFSNLWKARLSDSLAFGGAGVLQVLFGDPLPYAILQLTCCTR